MRAAHSLCKRTISTKNGFVLVEIRVDIDRLANRLGRKASTNVSGRSGIGEGCVEVIKIRDIPACIMCARPSTVKAPLPGHGELCCLCDVCFSREFGKI